MSGFLNSNQEFRQQACEILKEARDTEFWVRGALSARFGQ